METTSDLAQLAAEFVNSTSAHIFLTGKAGTGKTTFLKSLATSTHKNFAIVAPTGIAALNAGGVTIHSLFQLPLGTYLPDRTPSGNFSDSNLVYTQNTLARKHPLNTQKKQILRSIDLLIIDEVSMLRADLLDAIDYRMKAVKGNFTRSFGGVQVLMIGDLYQLPPVVKEQEQSYLRRYYNNPFFFEAKALQSDGLVYLELDKIYRQRDDRFIQLLNHFRNNTITKADIDTLNERYRSKDELLKEEDIITITTHNHKADELNRKALDQLPPPSYYYEADVSGEFGEGIYPLASSLELRKNAQIMFVKNDVSGQNKYFNGSIARVEELDEKQIIVRLRHNNERYLLQKETWENKKYSINPITKELDEEVVGTFTHYPIKLAWAITVHKSQGLTFDKAILDLGQAFAPGQVYVGLSRIKSLDGLFLMSKTSESAILNNDEVVEFSKRKNLQKELTEILAESRKAYLTDLVLRAFHFAPIIDWMNKNFESGNEPTGELLEDTHAIAEIGELLKSELQNQEKFKNQLLKILAEKNVEALEERIEKGRIYYTEKLKHCIEILLEHRVSMEDQKRVKGYVNLLEELDQMLTKAWEDLDKCGYIAATILELPEKKDLHQLIGERERFRINKIETLKKLTATTEKPKKIKKAKTKKDKSKDSESTTLEIYHKTKSIEQTAELRGLAKSTIETHLAHCIRSGKLDVSELLSEKALHEINLHIPKKGELSAKSIHQALEGKYSYAQIRFAINHHFQQSEKK